MYIYICKYVYLHISILFIYIYTYTLKTRLSAKHVQDKNSRPSPEKKSFRVWKGKGFLEVPQVHIYIYIYYIYIQYVDSWTKNLIAMYSEPTKCKK